MRKTKQNKTKTLTQHTPPKLNNSSVTITNGSKADKNQSMSIFPHIYFFPHGLKFPTS
jgi:hypothetical protein